MNFFHLQSQGPVEKIECGMPRHSVRAKWEISEKSGRLFGHMVTRPFFPIFVHGALHFPGKLAYPSF
jgi:hypothetical protein